MLIRVMYRDFRYDYIKPALLTAHLEDGSISVFRRKRGWVFVGIDPVRTEKQPAVRPFSERRHAQY